VATEPAPKIEVPKPAIPRTIGTLNIMFAVMLLLYGMCYGLTILVFPVTLSFPRMELGLQTQAERRKTLDGWRANSRAEIAKLREHEQAAQTETDRAELKEKRLDLEDQVELVEVIGHELLGGLGIDDPLVFANTLTDLISGLVLNMMMLIAGVGLIRFRDRGRKLGLWVAGLKILRLVVVCSISAAVITPMTTKRTFDRVQKMVEVSARHAARHGNAPVPQEKQFRMAKWQGAAGSALAVGMLVIGSIYPAKAGGAETPH
jgi:hypothetical protein